VAAVLTVKHKRVGIGVIVDGEMVHIKKITNEDWVISYRTVKHPPIPPRKNARIRVRGHDYVSQQLAELV